MPHKIITYDKWVEDIANTDPCLGRIVKEAVFTREAAIEAGAARKTAPKSCRKMFNTAETTIDAIRDGRLPAGEAASCKRASDALRKFTQALEYAVPSPR